MIQDIFPHRFNNQFLAHQDFKASDYIFCYEGNAILLKKVAEGYAFPKKQDFPEISDATEKAYLFSIDGISCFLIFEKPENIKSGIEFVDIGFFRTAAQQEVAWLSIAGFQIRNWYSQNQYCGKCGSTNQLHQEERAIVCPNCKQIIYPKISPAIIVAIVSGDKLLLARNSMFPGSWFSLVAGYVDVGESLEDTVRREVKEEVGIDVKSIRYYKSQPWPPSSSMMIGFVAEADESQPVVIDNKEIVEAAWFQRGKMPDHSLNISIAGEMIEEFEKGKL